MRKKLIILALILFTNSLQLLAQSFQKFYGSTSLMARTYSAALSSEGSIYSGGVIKGALSRGTLSKSDPSGTILWYKSYIPADFQIMDSYFINSVFESMDSSVYAFGTYLSEAATSGYYLQKTDDQGTLLWAQFIQDDSPSLMSKAIYANGAIYAMMGGKISKFDLNGQILATIKTDDFFFRDLYFTTSNSLVVTGETTIQDSVYFPVISFDEDLNFNYGSLCQYTNLFIYASSITEAPEVLTSDENDLIVSANSMTGPFSFNFRITKEGEIVWAKRFLDEVLSPSDILAVGPSVSIEPLSSSRNEFYQLSQFYFSDADVYLQEKQGLIKFSSDGDFTEFRVSGAQVGNLEVSDLIIDFSTASFYATGSWTTNDLNSLRLGNLEALGCEETNESIPLLDIQDAITVYPFDASLITFESDVAVPKSMITQNLLIDVDDMICSQALEVSGEEKSEIQFYPNPADNTVKLVTPGNGVGEIKIFDALGREIEQFTESGNQLDVSQLIPGVYIVNIILGDHVFSGRLIKE